MQLATIGATAGLTELGSGGFAVVYDAPGVTVPTYSGDLVYKEFRQPGNLPGGVVLTQQDVDVQIRQAANNVAFRDGLSAAERVELDACMCWPLEMVTQNGVPTGYLMPKLAPTYFMKTAGPQSSTRILEGGVLSATPKWCQRNGVSLQNADNIFYRFALVVHLAHGVALLHKHGRIYGDLSLTNYAFSDSSSTAVFMDCDSVCHENDSQRVQANSPGFFAPEVVDSGHPNYQGGLQSLQSDIYKLGLLCVRALLKGAGATQQSTTKALRSSFGKKVNDPKVSAMLATLDQCLERDPAVRPTADQVKDVFVELVRPIAGFPELLDHQMSQRTFTPGDAIKVSGTVANCQSVEVVVNGHGTPAAVDRAGTFEAVVFPVGVSSVEVQLKNGYGEVLVPVGQLVVDHGGQSQNTGLPGVINQACSDVSAQLQKAIDGFYGVRH